MQDLNNKIAQLRGSFPLWSARHAIVPFKDCCGADQVCLMGTRGRARARQCPLHGPFKTAGAIAEHCTTCRKVVQVLYELDAHVAVFPEFSVFCKGGHRRHGRGPTHRIDVLAVFQNGRCLAVEVDGRSHDNTANAHRDNRKDVLLKQHRVEIFRLSIRVPKMIDSELHDLKMHVQSMLV